MSVQKPKRLIQYNYKHNYIKMIYNAVTFTL